MTRPSPSPGTSPTPPASPASATLTLLVPLSVGVGVGVLAARREGGPLDRIISALTLAVHAVPEFAVGVLLATVFGLWLGWLPPTAVRAAPHLRGLGPARRETAAARPPRPIPCRTGRRPVRVPGREGGLRRAQAGPGPGRPQRGTPPRSRTGGRAPHRPDHPRRTLPPRTPRRAPLAAAAALADRIAVLDAGRIAESGPTGPLIETPQHPITRGLLSALPTGDSVSGGDDRLRDPCRPGSYARDA